MKIMHGPRGSGKTTEAIEKANEIDGVVVVVSNQHKHVIMDRCDNEPLTHHDILRGKHQGLNKPIVIDELDAFIHSIIGPSMPVEAATLTPDAIEELDP